MKPCWCGGKLVPGIVQDSLVCSHCRKSYSGLEVLQMASGPGVYTANPLVGANAVHCASCGTRRDQHGQKPSLCPRFVVPPNPVQSRRGMATQNMYAGIAPTPNSATRYVDYMFKLTDDKPEVPQTAADRLEALEARLGRTADYVTATLDRQKQQIEDLEKQLKQFNWDPQLHKMVKDKLDYSQMISDEEEMLEVDYRGWPTIKERIVF